MLKFFSNSVRSTLALILALIALTLSKGNYALAESEQPIPVDTVISLQNWQQYKAFMPEGMQALFAGTQSWKFPTDFKLVVGPTHDYPLPREYSANTEKYSHLVKIVELPDGGHSVSGYVAGLPFPNPAEPMKGYKVLVNNWYRYTPYIYCGNDANLYLVNQAHQVTSYRFVEVIRRFNHISDVGQPIADSRAQGVHFSEYIMQLQPEQDKYTEILTLFYVDPTKREDEFIFVPKLRRVIRGSPNSRCAPFGGGDITPDDFTGFEGGFTRFQADFIKDQPVLALTTAEPGVYGDLANYYSLNFPKPIVGSWEVRDSYVIDTRRLPSLRAGYCYGKRIMWVDKCSYNTIWADVYDPGMKLFKVEMAEEIAARVGSEGMQLNTGNEVQTYWDIQKGHLSSWITSGSGGKGIVNGEACRNLDGVNYYDMQYSSVGGLTQIMR